MKKWVLGFLFNEEKDEVLLIKKLRGPAFNIGKLNGIGGKIEKYESPLEAISRESKEEIDLCAQEVQWKHIFDLDTDNGTVCVFAASGDIIYAAKQKEEEPIAIYDVDDIINGLQVCPVAAMNLNWMIPMCLNILNNVENCQAFEVNEIYD